MALSLVHEGTDFGVGDYVRITQKIKEEGKETEDKKTKSRLQSFEGIVISIKGKGNGKTFTVRRIGAGNIGIEKIFPLYLPSLEKIKVLKKGTSGVRRSKLYYLRNSPKQEMEKIFARAKSKDVVEKASVKKVSTKRKRTAKVKKSNAPKKKK